MLEKIINFIKSNPDIPISLLALLLSLYNFLYCLITRRCKLKIIVHKYSCYNSTYQFYITIQNCSQMPISISNICINESYFCVVEPTTIKEITHRTGNIVTSRTEIKTIPFPVNLNSLESFSGYLEFRKMENFNENNFYFSAFTNRKAIKHIKPLSHDDLSKKL